MNALLRTIYCGYQNFLLVGQARSAVAHFSECANVSELQIQYTKPEFLAHHLPMRKIVDLLVIDVDSVGVDEAAYLHFLAFCIRPELPVVLMAADLNTEQQKRFMSSGVLEILSGASTSRILSVAT